MISRSPQRILSALASTALVAGGLSLVVPSSAQAASTTFTVTTNADSGGGSLREAITSANATADDDTIIFDASFSTPQTITLASELPKIEKPLTIVGPGRDNLTISGANSFRVLNVLGTNVAPGLAFSLSGVTLADGVTDKGAGLYLKFALATLSDIAFIDGAASGQGGGIYSISSDVTITDSLFEGNSAASTGGAIYSDYNGSFMPVVRLSNSVVKDNTAGSSGGGIHAYRAVVLTDDTFTGNTATSGNGGAVYFGPSYNYPVTRTTFTGNSAVTGGAIAAGYVGHKGRLDIQGSVISDNTATSGDGSGGIYLASMIMSITDSTVSNGVEGNCLPVWGIFGNPVIFANIVDTTGTSLGDSSCTQLDRAASVTSYSAVTAGASIATTMGDPSFLPGDSITLCKPGGCTVSGIITGVVTDTSTADDTFAFTQTTAKAETWTSSLGALGGAWVDLPKLISASPDSADPGDTVTLTGSGFGDPAAAPTTSVSVGGQAATNVTLIDDTTITFTVPSGAGGAVTVGVGSDANTAAVTWGYRDGILTVSGSPSPTPTPTPTPEPVFPASAPLDVEAVAGERSATIAWTAPASSGSFPVTNYQVASSPAGGVCLATTTTCEIKGLVDGEEYTFSVRALNGAGWSPWSSASNSVTPEPNDPPEVTISIIGTRADVRSRRGIEISGVTTGMSMGAILRPWVRMRGEVAFTEGIARIEVSDSGEFQWQRRTAKKATVYVATPDGSVRSNRVTIR